MSLGVVVKGPEGVVLAADCRVTLQAEIQRADGVPAPPLVVHFDNASKLLNLSPPHDYVGVVTYGAALVGQMRTPHSYVPEFEVTLPRDKRLTTREYAEQVSKFFLARWNEGPPELTTNANITFIVAGYDPGPEEAYGKVYVIDLPNRPEPHERNPNKNDFGMTWGGQIEVVSRLINGYDPAMLGALVRRGMPEPEVRKLVMSLRPELEFKIPFNILPLQDCIDLATFLIRTTITAHNLAIGVRGVGGMIEVAYVTRTQPLQFIQRKKLHGESQRWGGQ